MSHLIETPHVLPIRAGVAGERVETWRVRVTAETYEDRPVTPYNQPSAYYVHAERDPDVICAEVASTTPLDVGRSLGVARERARQLARVIACGKAVACPGIVACIGGAACPFDIKP